MSRLANKISQLSLIKNAFRDIGKSSLDQLPTFDNEYKASDHYRKFFKDKQHFDQLIDLNLQIKSLLNQYVDTSKKLQEQVNKTIFQKEQKILQADYERYSKQQIEQELLDNRNQNISDDFVDMVTSIIANSSDWRLSACVIEPTDARFVKTIVANEPLYVVTKNQESIKRVKGSFNNFYAEQRLRIYNDFKYLPKQIGLTLCINQFEYMPLDYQGDILLRAYKHTIPGGRMIITYNNCDNRTSLEHTLSGIRYYSTAELTLGKAFSIGWDVEQSDSASNGIWHYAVLKKPGEISSIKNSAAMVENIKKKVVERSLEEREADYLKRTQENLRLKAEGKIK